MGKGLHQTHIEQRTDLQNIQRGKGKTPPLLVGMQAGTAPLDVSMAISQKIRKQPTLRPSNTTFGYISKGCSIVQQGHVLSYIHSSFFLLS